MTKRTWATMSWSQIIEAVKEGAPGAIKAARQRAAEEKNPQRHRNLMKEIIWSNDMAKEKQRG